MATDVSWPESSGIFVQGGEDQILVTVTTDPAVVNGGQPSRVGLEVASDITWLKRLRLLASNGDEIATVTTKDHDRGPYWLDLPPDVAAVEFVKAKTAFYVPTGMYVSYPGGPFIPGGHGRVALFRWERD